MADLACPDAAETCAGETRRDFPIRGAAAPGLAAPITAIEIG